MTGNSRTSYLPLLRSSSVACLNEYFSNTYQNALKFAIVPSLAIVRQWISESELYLQYAESVSNLLNIISGNISNLQSSQITAITTYINEVILNTPQTDQNEMMLIRLEQIRQVLSSSLNNPNAVSLSNSNSILLRQAASTRLTYILYYLNAVKTRFQEISGQLNNLLFIEANFNDWSIIKSSLVRINSRIESLTSQNQSFINHQIEEYRRTQNLRVSAYSLPVRVRYPDPIPIPDTIMYGSYPSANTIRSCNDRNLILQRYFYALENGSSLVSRESNLNFSPINNRTNNIALISGFSTFYNIVESSFICNPIHGAFDANNHEVSGSFIYQIDYIQQFVEFSLR